MFGVIEECDASVADARETHWIQELNTYKNGYNTMREAKTYEITPQTRAKMSATWRAKGTSNRKGKTNNPEDNKRRSETLKAYWATHTHPRKGKPPWNKATTSS